MKSIPHKFIVVLFLLWGSFLGQAQENDLTTFSLGISPVVDTNKTENQEVISVLKSFLSTKNASLTENAYWLSSDVEKYQYPYAAIYRIEYGANGRYEYKPTLMELLDIGEQEKLLKIGFVKYQEATDTSIIIAIYNIVAVKDGQQWYLKSAIDYQTRDWNKRVENSITYYLPKGKMANRSEMDAQKKDIKLLCQFLSCKPIPISYYSCDSPKQLFEVKGFDYLPTMYVSETGGMADVADIIYSGNNSEYYTHEIVHIYIKKQFPRIAGILNEGIAMYIGGSGTFDYEWHRAKFGNYMTTADIELVAHLSPYENLYIDGETSVPYMIGALLCERTLRLYGKEALWELFSGEADLWDALEEIGITKENMQMELQKELQHQAYLIGAVK